MNCERGDVRALEVKRARTCACVGQRTPCSRMKARPYRTYEPLRSCISLERRRETPSSGTLSMP